METGVREMYEGLGHVVLATGEQVEVGVVIGPDAEWTERLERLLGHKGEPWNWQNRQVLTTDVGIGSRFYVLHRGGMPFANIMIAELSGVGILAHVWTKPEDREKGACSNLMRVVNWSSLTVPRWKTRRDSSVKSICKSTTARLHGH